MQLLKLKKNYKIGEVVKTLAITVDKKANAESDYVHFEFVVMIVKSSGADVYNVRSYREDLFEIKPMNAEAVHESILVKDDFFLDDQVCFSNEESAIGYIELRLQEIFGSPQLGTDK